MDATSNLFVNPSCRSINPATPFTTTAPEGSVTLIKSFDDVISVWASNSTSAICIESAATGSVTVGNVRR